MENPMISIVIACYNDADYIEQAVDSVRNQTYGNFEIIVVDDGSDEKTKSVLRILENKIGLLIFQENQGVSVARNRGIKASKGEYIMILDSDDYLETTFLEKAVAEFDADANVRMVSCYANLIYGKKNKGVLKNKGGSLVNFLNNNSALGTSLYKKEDIFQVGGYDEKMLLGLEDWEFNIRIMALGGIARIICEPLYNYRIKKHSRNEDAKKNKVKIWEYIILNNKQIYQQHFDEIMTGFFFRFKKLEKQKMNVIKSKEYRIGIILCAPFRFIRKGFIRRKIK